MSRKYKFRNDAKLYFITSTVVHWIDVFTRDAYRNILLDSWRHCQKHKGLEIYAWVIMPNHFHMIIGTNKDPLNGIIRDMKSYTSNTIKKDLFTNRKESRRDWMNQIMIETGRNCSSNNDWQLWQQGVHPIEIFHEKMFWIKANYIHENPVKAGFVEKMEDWKYSSAGDFYGKKGPIDLCF